MLMIKLPFICVFLLKESGKCLKSVQVFCGSTPNYEKTFDAPNQRPYHFQTAKLLFLVKQ